MENLFDNVFLMFEVIYVYDFIGVEDICLMWDRDFYNL